MHAMVLTQYGPHAHFERRALDQPRPAPGQVLVRIAATSVNTVDTKICAAGKALPLSPDLPAVLGMDFSGTVEAIGAGVQGFQPGDAVYGCAGGLADLPGSLAEFIAADVRLIAHKPSSLSMRAAAAVPLVGITAYEGLQRAGVQAGQRVLIHGGSGGVGHVAVQLAVHRGAEVFATGGSEEALAAIQSMGATPINYRSTAVADYVAEHTEGKGFDVVYDTVGDSNLLTSFEAAALNAQVVSTTTMVDLNLTLAHLKGLSLHVVFMLIPMLHNHGRQTHQNILADLARISDAGAYKPLLDRSDFHITEVAQAHQHLLSGQAMGKIVLRGF